MRILFDFPMSESWLRAYGLIGDDRPAPEHPPQLSIIHCRTIYNLTREYHTTVWRVVGDMLDSRVRDLAKELASRAIQYWAVNEGLFAETIRHYTHAGDKADQFRTDWRKGSL